MYTGFYGLKELPFAGTADPRFIYFTPSHTQAIANLHYGIESGKGLIVVTGEVGTGKTTMLRWVMRHLDRTAKIAYIFSPRLSIAEFYQHLAKLFDIRNWKTKSDFLFELGKFLESRNKSGLRTLLIVDEAQGISLDVLEEIRLLCNFESESAKQLQIILTGQPELWDLLNCPELRRLKQRVALQCEIKALPSVAETTEYINSRLKVAGANQPDIFSLAAVDYIFRCTEGIPRAVNHLCDHALLNGFLAGNRKISQTNIQEAAEAFGLLPRIAGVEKGEEANRIFPVAGSTELSARNDGNGNGKCCESDCEFIAISPVAEPDTIFEEDTRQTNSQTSIGNLTTAFFDSASTAHTIEATARAGTPRGSAFRDAGATLGAVGSTRAVRF
jgi:general secretion pathway protein A